MTSVESRQEPSYRPFLILNGRDKLVFVTAQQTRKLLRFIWVCGDWVRFSLVMSGTRTLSKACWTSQKRKKSQAQLSVIQPKTKWKKWPSNAHKWMLGAKKVSLKPDSNVIPQIKSNIAYFWPCKRDEVLYTKAEVTENLVTFSQVLTSKSR